jgi:hypothetical protein
MKPEGWTSRGLDPPGSATGTRGSNSVRGLVRDALVRRLKSGDAAADAVLSAMIYRLIPWYAFVIIVLAIKLVLMFFYPLTDGSVPLQTIVQYWKLTLKVIRWEAYLAATVVIAVFFMGGIVVVSALYRKGIAKVFLSYHHSNYHQVLDFAASLRNAGFNPLFVEFTTTPQHDKLLDEIYIKIEIADFVICFPGLEPSFVESEISAAIAGKKPIFIILPQRNNGAPNTSQKSYPALTLENLQREQFASIFSILDYLYGDWRNTVKLLCGRIKLFGSGTKHWQKFGKATFFAPVYAIGISFVFFVLLKVLAFVAFIMPFINHIWSTLFGQLQMQFLFVVLIPSLTGAILIWKIVSVLGASWVRWRARLIVRRQIEQGTYAFHSLTKLFDDDLTPLLRPFFKDPPKAHHEMTQV